MRSSPLSSGVSNWPVCSIYDSSNPPLPLFEFPAHCRPHHDLSVAVIMALPFGKNDASSSDSSRIKGNLPPKVKQMLDTVMHEIMARPNVFGASIGERVAITEASIIPKTEEPSRTEARVVCEVTVTEGESHVEPMTLLRRGLNRRF